MEKVRLTIFLNSSERAGIEEVALALAKGLDPARYQVHLAAPQPLLDALAPDLRGCPIETFAVHLTSLGQWAEMRRLVRFLRRRRIQIVNSHGFYATLFAAPLARLAGVPVVIETCHGPEAWRKSWWKRKYWVDRLIETMVTLNIAVSEANRRYLLIEKRYPARKLRVVPNGRDLARYAAAQEEELREIRLRFGIPHDARVVAVVARLDSQKGHRYLLEALPAVVARFPHLRVILLGDGNLRSELERVVAERGLQEQVVFAGFQQPVAPFYHLAEFLVLPSLYEGMPLVAIEAGAAGRAVVATAVDGTLEVIVDGETGVLVAPAAPAALATAILWLLEQPGEARRMGQAARRRMESLFSLDRQLEQTSRLYLECLIAQPTEALAR